MHRHTEPDRHASSEDLEQLPLDEPARRQRLRRGGPRTPLPLLPVIAIAAGIGVAYVSQSAHTTAATYEVSSLAAQQQRLKAQDQQLTEELSRLDSSERIVAAAQHLGMRPANQWAYVASQPAQVMPSAKPQTVSTTDPARDLIAALTRR
jgi:cell division protein FtsL